jgi:hypothetical protein
MTSGGMEMPPLAVVRSKLSGQFENEFSGSEFCFHNRLFITWKNTAVRKTMDKAIV